MFGYTSMEKGAIGQTTQIFFLKDWGVSPVLPLSLPIITARFLFPHVCSKSASCASGGFRRLSVQLLLQKRRILVGTLASFCDEARCTEDPHPIVCQTRAFQEHVILQVADIPYKVESQKCLLSEMCPASEPTAIRKSILFRLMTPRDSFGEQMDTAYLDCCSRSYWQSDSYDC